MVSNILDVINNQLSGIHSEQKIYGLAQSVLIQNTNETFSLLPGIIMADGEITYVGIDDVDSLIVYHKLQTAIFKNINNGRGDKFGDSKNTYSINMVVYWKRNKINLLPDEMLMLFQARIPAEIIGLKDIKQTTITPTGAILNTLQVFNGEYGNQNGFRIPANMHLIQINYQIDITFNPDCFKQCINC